MYPTEICSSVSVIHAERIVVVTGIMFNVRLLQMPCFHCTLQFVCLKVRLLCTSSSLISFGSIFDFKWHYFFLRKLIYAKYALVIHMGTFLVQSGHLVFLYAVLYCFYSFIMQNNIYFMIYCILS